MDLAEIKKKKKKVEKILKKGHCEHTATKNSKFQILNSMEVEALKAELLF